MTNNKKKIAFLGILSTNKIDLIHYLVSEQSDILKSYVDKVIIYHMPEEKTISEYTYLRKMFLRIGVPLDLKEFTTYDEVLGNNYEILVPMTNKIILELTNAWSSYYKINAHNFSYWRPTAAISRLVTPYNPEWNDGILMTDLLSKYDESPETGVGKLSGIEELDLSWVNIPCSIVKEFNEAFNLPFAERKSTKYIWSVLESFNGNKQSHAYVLKSSSSDFSTKIYIDDDIYYSSRFASNNAFRNVSDIASDIIEYSIKHPTEILYLQPYYLGDELRVNCYVDDDGKVHYSAFAVVDSDIHSSFRIRTSSKLSNTLQKIADKLMLKYFSIHLTQMSDDKWGVLSINYEWNDLIGASSRYCMDPITYEITRGEMTEPSRKNLLSRKYETEYVDKLFSGSYIFQS